MSSDWRGLEGLEPLAPRVGPFPSVVFVEAWWRRHGSGSIHVVAAGPGALAIWRDGGVARLAGHADLTDYHSPLGDDPTSAVEAALEALPPGTAIDFDSLPDEAATPLAAAVQACGVDVEVVGDGMTMVVELGSHDAFLEAIGARERHEARRKRRRFEAEGGVAVAVRDPGAIEAFAALHRSTPGEKGGFMTDAMEAFFGDLLGGGARLDVLRDQRGTLMAAAFGFDDADTYYLYNMAFDRERASASPGAVLLHLVIEEAIRDGRTRFDLLKGPEPYKRRLGAVPRRLFRIRGTT